MTVNKCTQKYTYRYRIVFPDKKSYDFTIDSSDDKTNPFDIFEKVTGRSIIDPSLTEEGFKFYYCFVDTDEKMELETLKPIDKKD